MFSSNLRSKLLLLLLFAIGLSTFLVGGILAWYAQRQHQEDAELRFAAARQVVTSIVERIEHSAQAHAAGLSIRDDVIAPLGMISRYQSKTDYQSLIFDPEKRRLAEELAHEVLSHRGDVSDRLVALYDAHGDLVCFAVTDGEHIRAGFVRYRAGQPIIQSAQEHQGTATSEPPALLRDRYSGDVPAPPVLRYLVRNGTLFVQASAPLERNMYDGSRSVVGRVVVGGLLDKAFIDAVTQEAGILLSLAGPNVETSRIAGFAVPTAALREGAPHWRSGSVDTLDIGGLLVKRFALPLAGESTPALLIMAVDKGPLLAEMRQTRDVVLAVLLVTTLLVLPLGVGMGRRSIADPVGRLVDRVEAIRRGTYVSGPEDQRDDEFGWLGRNISAMANTIRLREQDLRDSQESLKEAQRVAQIGNWDWNSTDGRLRCSDEVYRILELPSDGPAGADYLFVLPHIVADERERIEQLLRAAVEEGTPYQAEYRLLRQDGSVQSVYEQVRVHDAPSGNRQLFGTLQVVTELRRVENALRHSNRALRTLSACNQDLVHADCERELLDSVCRDLVEVGEYRLAWIGFAEAGPERRVRPVAYAGAGTDYLEEIRITWDDTPEGSGPTGTAIRTGQPQVMRDIHHDPAFAPWRAAAIEHGYASSLAFPLTDERRRVFGALNLYSSVPDAFDDTEITLLAELAGDIAFGITNLRVRQAHDELAREREGHLQRLQSSMQSTVQVLSSTIEIRDPYTAGHQRRVAQLATAIARELAMEEERIRGLYLAGLIHDIGKINVPVEILSKPGNLSQIELSIIRAHPVAGYEIIKDVQFPWPIAEMVHQHHERLDGTGYPQGLAGDSIMPEARILMVADVVEAMASDRPYRPGLGVDEALEEIDRNRGRFYDAEVADACIRLFRDKAFEFIASERGSY